MKPHVCDLKKSKVLMAQIPDLRDGAAMAYRVLLDAMIYSRPADSVEIACADYLAASARLHAATRAMREDAAE
jgi:hypothetical protein